MRLKRSFLLGILNFYVFCTFLDIPLFTETQRVSSRERFPWQSQKSPRINIANPRTDQICSTITRAFFQ